jgi:protein disulfide-isomerase
MGRYWDNSATGNYIMVSRTAISETLDKIVYGPQVIKPKLRINIFQKMWLDIRIQFSDHPYLSFGGLAGILFGLFSWYRSHHRRSRHAYFSLDDTMGIGQQLKDGLLGQNGNTKSD